MSGVPYVVDLTRPLPEIPAAGVLIGCSHGLPPTHAEHCMPQLVCTLVDECADADVPLTCIVVDDAELEAKILCDRISANPMAAAVLMQLLRLEPVSVLDALVAESLAYSTLLGGPEFGAWLAERGPRTLTADDEPPVLVARADNELTITLNRPTKHNAYSARMRDALIEALDVAVYDSSITRVALRGAGPSFCSGGDLDEFGTTPDPATAHLIRIQRSVAARLDAVSDRLVAHLHGACIGAGIEFAAFCGEVRAGADAFFQMPELAMGLVPGAGGTVSVTRRIGRWRTAYLALSGRRIDVDTALAWQLVDRRSDD